MYFIRPCRTIAHAPDFEFEFEFHKWICAPLRKSFGILRGEAYTWSWLMTLPSMIYIVTLRNWLLRLRRSMRRAPIKSEGNLDWKVGMPGNPTENPFHNRAYYPHCVKMFGWPCLIFYSNDVSWFCTYAKSWPNLAIYCEVSNISRTSIGNEIVDHTDLVGSSPVGAAPTPSSFST